jgi:hypothetical protein
LGVIFLCSGNTFFVESDMLYRLGRLLQLAGLVILPVAITGDLAQKLDLKQSLALSAVGVAVFSGGWILQQGRKP